MKIGFFSLQGTEPKEDSMCERFKSIMGCDRQHESNETCSDGNRRGSEWHLGGGWGEAVEKMPEEEVVPWR